MNAQAHLIRGSGKFNRSLFREAITDFNQAIRLDPEAFQPRLYRAFAHQMLGRRREALEDLADALQTAPETALVQIQAAELLIGLGDCASALTHAEKALRLDPASSEARRLRLQLRIRSGWIAHHHGEARAAFKRMSDDLHQRRVRSVARRLEAAGVQMRLGDGEASLANLQAALKLDRGSALAHARLGTLRLWLGRYRRAMHHAQAALDADPRNPEALRVRGAAQLLLGRCPEALEDLNRVVALAPQDAESYIWRGEAKRVLGRTGEAFADIRRALSLGGDSVPALANLALILLAAPELESPQSNEVWQVYFERILKDRIIPSDLLDARSSRNPGRCRDALERLLRRLRGNRGMPPTYVRRRGGKVALVPWPQDRSDRALGRETLARLRVANADTVMREFNRLRARRPRSFPICNYRGEANLWLGRYAQARRDLERSLALNPQALYPHFGMALLETLGGRFEKARDWVGAASRITPPLTPGLLLIRGEAKRRSGEPAAAVADLAASLQGSPVRLSAWINLALARGALGDAAGLTRIYSHLREWAGSLIDDALMGAQFDGASPEQAGTVLERCLGMMLGNRASFTATYRNNGSGLRFLWIDPSHQGAMVRLVDAGTWLRP